jgi:hypothetical protein
MQKWRLAYDFAKPKCQKHGYCQEAG